MLTLSVGSIQLTAKEIHDAPAEGIHIQDLEAKFDSKEVIKLPQLFNELLKLVSVRGTHGWLRRCQQLPTTEQIEIIAEKAKKIDFAMTHIEGKTTNITSKIIGCPEMYQTVHKWFEFTNKY